MGIIHIVMFTFEPLAPAEDVRGVCDRMLALKDGCIHPQTKKPYIQMAMGGKNNSTEGLSGGVTHVFVSEFDNEEDRAYYLKEDTAHLAFVASIKETVSTAQVIDFAPGVF